MAGQNAAVALSPKTVAASPPTAAAAVKTAILPAAAAGKPLPGGEQEEARWIPALGLPCELSVDLPVPEFKISDLLNLCPGSVVDACWRVGHDLPLRLNGTLIGWTKVEVVGNRLAVRLTELA